METGIGYPDINTLEPLVDALGITLTELMNCARDEEIIASLEIASCLLYTSDAADE